MNDIPLCIWPNIWTQIVFAFIFSPGNTKWWSGMTLLISEGHFLCKTIFVCLRHFEFVFVIFDLSLYLSKIMTKNVIFVILELPLIILKNCAGAGWHGWHFFATLPMICCNKVGRYVVIKWEFWQFWQFLITLRNFDNIDNFWQRWQFLTTLTLSDNFDKFWQIWQFLTTSTISDNFDNFWQLWQFLTTLTISRVSFSCFPCFLGFQHKAPDVACLKHWSLLFGPFH